MEKEMKLKLFVFNGSDKYDIGCIGAVAENAEEAYNIILEYGSKQEFGLTLYLKKEPIYQVDVLNETKGVKFDESDNC